MYLRLSAIGLALLLAAGGPGAWAAGKPRDACFSNDVSPDEAIAGCNAVLSQRKREMTVDVRNAFHNRGLAYVKKGETERAIKDFSEAIALDPSFPNSFRNRGALFDDLERYDRALSDYDQAIKLDPKHTPTFILRGVTFLKTGELKKAISDFDAAIALDPKDASNFVVRGLTFNEMGEPGKAISDFDAAIALDPKNAQTFANRGLTFSKMGEPGKAISDFEAAIALDPKRGRTYYDRALEYEKTGDPARALADLETAARLAPDDEEVQPALKRLRAVVQARPAAPAIAPDASAPKAPGSGSSAPGGPATLADLEAQEKATVAIWERLPFTTRRAMFVTRKANGYGDYEARSSNVFEPGEKLITYFELLGFTWAAKGDGYRFGVSVDFEIVSAGGKILGGQKGLFKQELESRDRNRELFLDNTMSVDGAPAGSYVLIYIVHDLGSNRTTRVEQPFTIKAASAATR